MEWNKPLQDLFYVVLYSLIQTRSQLFRKYEVCGSSKEN